MENVITTVVEQLSNFLIGAAKREISYMFYYRRNISRLEEEIEKLGIECRKVEREVEAAKNNIEEIEEDVTYWMEMTKSTLEEMGGFLQGQEERIQKRCFKLHCPSPWARYKLGREAVKKMEVVTRRIRDGKFDKISHPVSLYGVGHITTSGYTPFESRAIMFEAVMMALRDDNVKVVGICGMAGVGKSTMAEEVRKEALKQKIFDEVAVAVVSQTVDVIKIQGNLADCLGFQFHGQENEQIRAAQLGKRLKAGKKTLIVLDDVWAKLDLQAIGIIVTDNFNGCKILMTSRDRKVLKDNHCPEPFTLGVLSPKEAWILFKQNAGNCVDLPEVQTLAKQVCEECCGLPLVIEVVASGLRDETDSSSWKDVYQKFTTLTPYNINEMEEKVYKPLRVSYNQLKDEEAQSCFLLCSLFPEDAELSVDYLLKHAMPMGFLANVETIDEARTRVIVLLKKLKTASLLLAGSTSDTVKMHDVLRDMAFAIASDNEKYKFFVSSLPRWPKVDKLEGAKVISVTSKKIDQLPDELKCPKLHTLVLECSSRPHWYRQRVPDSFFNGLGKELRVLSMINVSVPSSLSGLTNLRMLYLNHCMLADTAIFKGLEQLEMLSLRGFEYKELSPELRRLTRLRLLDLTDCSELKSIPSHLLSSLLSLEELFIPDFKKWGEAEATRNEASGNASVLELNLLSNLTTLQSVFPNATVLPDGQRFEKLLKYHITVGTNDKYFSTYEAENTLELSHHSVDSTKVKNLAERAERLYLNDMKGLRKIFDGRYRKGFVNLKHLEISSCVDMKHLLVEGISQDQGHSSFSMLKVLIIDDSGFKYLFSKSVAKGLVQLEKLEIRNCGYMEGIVRNDDELDQELIFQHLKFMSLDNLPNLRSFCSKKRNTSTTNGNPAETELSLFDMKVSFPALEKLYVDGLDAIIAIWGTRAVMKSSFCNLRLLHVQVCSGLKNVIPPSILGNLQNLQHLSVSHCHSLVSEVAEPLVATANEKTPLPMLRTLTLDNLSTMSRMGLSLMEDSLGILLYPNLKTLEVSSCNHLKNLFSPITASKLLHLEELIIDSCENMEEIIISSKGCPWEKFNIIFPQLKKLELKRLSNLKSFEGSETNEQEKDELVSQDKYTRSSLFLNKVAFPALEELHIVGLHSISEVWESRSPLLNSFYNLKALHVIFCERLKSVIPLSMLGRLLNLELLEVRTCNSLISEIADPLGLPAEEIMPLPKLSQLKLTNLPNFLVMVVNSLEVSYGILMYPNLKTLNIHNCNTLRYVFSPSVARKLLYLEDLSVSRCDKMEVIISGREESDVEDMEIVFPRLRALDLGSLQNMTCFWRWESSEEDLKMAQKLSQGHGLITRSKIFFNKVAFPALDRLDLQNMNSIRALWESRPLMEDTICYLRVIDVRDCAKLEHVIPSDMVSSLEYLTEIHIGSCESLISVFDYEEPCAGEDNGMTSLPRLNHIFVDKCLKVERVISPVIQERLLKLKQLEIFHINQ